MNVSLKKSSIGYVISYIGMGCDMYIKLVEGELMGLYA